MTAPPILSTSVGAGSPGRRRSFGLDTMQPANAATIEAEVLRILAAEAPHVLTIRPSTQPDRARPAGHRAVPAFVGGTPDLLLLFPGGRSLCLKIRTQAERLSHDHVAFGHLCRHRDIPYVVVRSVAEARRALGQVDQTLKGARS
ncbi:hypothetical protein [Lichenihabitans psoromatis]|uniref:hypothetical protein n=1 Tax=Lichenihabitans psoromatis TaxID=2528642 RepID=UPI0010383832|nr:hypothetical protein [Lichenihabitans psoromatis]